jgi:hypothetical protein
MALLSNGQLAKCPRCGMNIAGVRLTTGQIAYHCTWTFCEDKNKTLWNSEILARPVLTQAQKDSYRISAMLKAGQSNAQIPGFFAQAYAQAQAPTGSHPNNTQPIYPIYSAQPRRTSMKEIRITYLYNNTIVELYFITMPRKGWFKDNIQPVIDVMKNMIPANAREYDPATFKWQIAIEYWPALRQILTSTQFAVKEVSPSTSHANVPKDYAENFYHAPVKREVETKESILVLLAKLLGIHEDIASMELVALKKKYREAARRYHPDLGGDAAKMAELNRVWSIYNTN